MRHDDPPLSSQIEPSVQEPVADTTHEAYGSIDVLGVDINILDMSQLLGQLDDWITEAHGPSIDNEPSAVRCHQVCTVNPEFVVDAQRDPAFAEVLRRADLRVADGAGIVWAARLRGIRLPERITGSDGIYRICERAAEEGWRVFFLGAAPGVADRTAAALRIRYPKLIVAGTYAGSPEARDWPLIHDRLSVATPDILFVAYGHPRQDIWIDRHRHELPAAVALGVGGAFDFVAGVSRRAPRWMRRIGLEWLHRLSREPWRWHRMSKLPVFVALAARQAASRRT
jgi:N-acetylglucosaminyldiphosphoundecaprenol N-acetyl-beta-D-mannosaminyltransferase